MKSIISIIMAISIIMMPLEALAQKKISNLVKGQPAQFDGILLSPEAYAELAISSSLNEELLNLKLKREIEQHDALSEFKLANQKLKYEADVKSLESRIEAKDSYIKELQDVSLQPVSWFDNWKFELGFATGLVVTLASFYVFVQAQNAN